MLQDLKKPNLTPGFTI